MYYILNIYIINIPEINLKKTRFSVQDMASSLWLGTPKQFSEYIEAHTRFAGSPWYPVKRSGFVGKSTYLKPFIQIFHFYYINV